ncbi:MAG: AAA family ATPase [Phycisphaeraceae bacterium]
MRITSINIQGFRAIESQRLDFEDRLRRPRPVTVIAGPNGCGKTSILFAVTNALRGVMGYRTEDVPPPSQDDIRLPSGRGGWHNAPSETRVEVELAISKDEQQAIRKVLQIVGWDVPPALPDDRLKVTWRYPPGFDKDGKPHSVFSADVSPAIFHIRSWLAGRRLAINAWQNRMPGMTVDLLLQVGGLWLFPQDRNLLYRVVSGNGTAGQTLDDNPMIDMKQDAEFEDARSGSRPERSVSNILKFLSEYVWARDEKLPPERNWEKRVQELFNKVCAPKEYVGYKYRGDSPLGAPVIRDGDAQYPLSQAASGELVVLEYATRLTYPSPLDRSIILIDEPEIHLHPTWVRKLYMALPEWGHENQFILTTHSLELKQRAQADGCLVDLGSLDS